MKMLKGKVEAYVISTMEDNQRTSLLDNLAISVEKLEDEANMEILSNTEKTINEGDNIVDFIDCLLAILNHELRPRRSKLKPSFWYVAETISPKDTIQVIYRLNMQQSDKTRCQAWLRNTLKEGSLGSYLSMLSEDTGLLKDYYKPAAFVRDSIKMDSAKSLINFTITSIVFNINIEPRIEKPKPAFNKKFKNTEFSSDKMKSPNRKKHRGGSVNMAKIADCEDGYENLDYNYHFNTNKSPEVISTSSVLSESSTQSDPDKQNESTVNTDSKIVRDNHSDDIVSDTSEHLPETSLSTIEKRIERNPSEICAVEPISKQSLVNKFDSGQQTTIEYTDQIDDKFHVDMSDISNDKILQHSSSEDNKDFSNQDSTVSTNTVLHSSHCENILSGDTLLLHKEIDYTETGSDSRQHNKDNHDINSLSSSKQSMSLCDSIRTMNDSITLNNESSANTQINGTKESISDSQNEVILKDDGSGINIPSHSTSPKINVSGSLNHSKDSLFQSVSKMNQVSSIDISQSSISDLSTSLSPVLQDGDNELLYAHDPDHLLSSSYNDSMLHDPRTSQVIESFSSSHKKDTNSPNDESNVIHENSITTFSSNDCENYESGNGNATSLKSKVRETVETPQKTSQCNCEKNFVSPIENDYRNQKVDYTRDNSTDVIGSSQLPNILNSNEYSPKDTYYVPGIHCSTDMNKSILKRTYTTPSNMSHSLEDTPSNKNDNASKLKRSATFANGPTDLISTANLNYFDDSGSDSCSTSDQSFSILADLGITDDFIGLKENHFSSDNFMGFSSSEELENAIATCKQLIKEAPDSQRKKDLVIQLVNLRLKLHEDKEKVVETQTKSSVKKILGHQFSKQGKVPSTMICDSCGVTIFPLLQTVYMCKDCGFHCHRKCLKHLEKPCVNSFKLSSNNYELRVCPISTLAKQEFRCADCRKRFVVLQENSFECRLCDYSGMFYCSSCHWNELMVMPARVVHNWDFSLRKVSRQSRHTLLLMSKKPNINLKKLNPSLFNFVDELRDIRTLREQILKMKKYVMSCRIATEERLLLTLQQRQHFVDNSDIYSLQDLLDLNSNLLLGELTQKHTTLAKHIKIDCVLCQGKGFICELCRSDEIIYPFDQLAYQCKCNATFHRQCYFNADHCPKCERDERRKSKH